jgi:TPR repeat protein
MTPAAFEKAQSLYRFACDQGALLSTFELALTNIEGLELVDWFVTQVAHNEVLCRDVEIAHATGNPWEVLENFRYWGFHMIPAQALN